MARPYQTFQQIPAPDLSMMERNGKAVPIIFIHGNGFSKEVFSRQFESSELADHRLISLDLPGHGASTNAIDPHLEYSFHGMAQTALHQLDRMGIGKCIVVGWSLGGHVALEMLANDMVAGVLAVGAPPAPNGPMGLIRAFNVNRMLLLAGKASFSRSDAVFFEQCAVGDHANGSFVDRILRVDPNLRPALSRSLLLGSGHSQRDIVLRSNKPIALVAGDNDYLVRQSYLNAIQSPALYSGSALTLPGCGHAPFMEQQKAFDHLLKSFADDVVSGTAMVHYPAPKRVVNG